MKPSRTAPKFSVGQTVIFINDYGVNWGERTIVETKWDDVMGNVYLYADSISPWYFTPERMLYALEDVEAISKATMIVAMDSIHYRNPRLEEV